jgi:hypothetical protein
MRHSLRFGMIPLLLALEGCNSEPLPMVPPPPPPGTVSETAPAQQIAPKRKTPVGVPKTKSSSQAS